MSTALHSVKIALKHINKNENDKKKGIATFLVELEYIKNEAEYIPGDDDYLDEEVLYKVLCGDFSKEQLEQLLGKLNDANKDAVIEKAYQSAVFAGNLDIIKYLHAKHMEGYYKRLWKNEGTAVGAHEALYCVILLSAAELIHDAAKFIDNQKLIGNGHDNDPRLWYQGCIHQEVLQEVMDYSLHKNCTFEPQAHQAFNDSVLLLFEIYRNDNEEVSDKKQELLSFVLAKIMRDINANRSKEFEKIKDAVHVDQCVAAYLACVKQDMKDTYGVCHLVDALRKRAVKNCGHKLSKEQNKYKSLEKIVANNKESNNAAQQQSYDADEDNAPDYDEDNEGLVPLHVGDVAPDDIAPDVIYDDEDYSALADVLENMLKSGRGSDLEAYLLSAYLKEDKIREIMAGVEMQIQAQFGQKSWGIANYPKQLELHVEVAHGQPHNYNPRAKKQLEQKKRKDMVKHLQNYVLSAIDVKRELRQRENLRTAIQKTLDLGNVDDLYTCLSAQCKDVLGWDEQSNDVQKLQQRVIRRISQIISKHKTAWTIENYNDKRTLWVPDAIKTSKYKLDDPASFLDDNIEYSEEEQQKIEKERNKLRQGHISEIEKDVFFMIKRALQKQNKQKQQQAEQQQPQPLVFAQNNHQQQQEKQQKQKNDAKAAKIGVLSVPEMVAECRANASDKDDPGIVKQYFVTHKQDEYQQAIENDQALRNAIKASHEQGNPQPFFDLLEQQFKLTSKEAKSIVLLVGNHRGSRYGYDLNLDSMDSVKEEGYEMYKMSLLGHKKGYAPNEDVYDGECNLAAKMICGRNVMRKRIKSIKPEPQDSNVPKI